MLECGKVSPLAKWHHRAQLNRADQKMMEEYANFERQVVEADLEEREARAKVELGRRAAADFKQKLMRWQGEGVSVFSDNNHVERVLGKPTSTEARSKVALKQQATTFGQWLGNTDFKQKLMLWQGEGVSVFSDENHVARVVG